MHVIWSAPGLRVGYKTPPKHTQFQKGQSGNPKGRPKNSKNLLTLLETELKRPVSVQENGKRRTISKREAMIKRLVHKAMEGDARTAHLIFSWLAANAGTLAEQPQVIFQISNRPPKPGEIQDKKC